MTVLVSIRTTASFPMTQQWALLHTTGYVIIRILFGSDIFATSLLETSALSY